MPYTHNPNEIVLGIDVGSTNIGLAFGRNQLVSPLAIISGKDQQTAINEIIKQANSLKADKVVVGLPQTADQKETTQSQSIRHFVKLLKVYFKKPIEFINEYATTQEAISELIKVDSSKKRRGVVDDVSAALILKRYFDGD